MAIELKNVKKTFGKKEVLHGVNITFEKGICGLLGPNGAGKTTLMSIMVGLLNASAGEVLFDGEPVTKNKNAFLRKLGFLPQYPGYYKNYTAAEFLAYMSALKGIPGKNKTQIHELLNFVNLGDYADQKVGTFSGGMLRRVGLAQTLLGDPDVIILDEPTAGLDPIERIRLRNLLSEIAQNRTVIIATHIVPDIEYIANKVVLLFDGQVKTSGTPETLIQEINGKVWSVRADLQTAEDYVKRYQISNIFSEETDYVLRIVSEEQPCDTAESIFPNLEDVFLYHSIGR